MRWIIPYERERILRRLLVLHRERDVPFCRMGFRHKDKMIWREMARHYSMKPIKLYRSDMHIFLGHSIHMAKPLNRITDCM